MGRPKAGDPAVNACISLKRSQLGLLEEECKWLSMKLGRRYTKSELARHALREYFGDDWDKVTSGIERSGVRKSLPKESELMATAEAGTVNGVTTTTVE